MANAQSNSHNSLTDQEKADGWMLLFDGSTTEGWRGYNDDAFPDKGWAVVDGVLMVRPPGEEDEYGGDIITTRKYRNFILKMEWKVEKGGNSGIFYHGIEQPTQRIYWSAPEYQVLDNENHPDANRGENGNRKSASLYDLIPPEPQDAAKPFGEWNQAKIVVDNPHVEHWLNGVKVLEYDRWTPGWYEMLRNSKFVDHPEFGDAHRGYIGLQDHGDQVSFRNIKIRELD